MRERLRQRWHFIRMSRANLALVIAGAVLIVMSPVWRFGVAPAIKVVANDFDSLYSFEGTLSNFVDPVVEPQPAAAPTVVPMLLEQRLSGRPDISTPSISAVQENMRLVALDTGEDLNNREYIFTIARRSGELVDAKGADRERSGYYIVFPFNTPEEDLPYWVEQVGGTETAVYKRRRKVEGVSCLEFEVEYHNVPVAAPEGFPKAKTGAELKAMLGMPGLALADGETIELAYLGAGRRTVLVEPIAGTPVKLDNVEESVSIAAGKSGGGFAVTRLVSSLRYTQSEQSVKQAAVFAKDEVAKIKLQFTYIPLGLAALGLFVLIVGAFAGIKHIRKTSERPDAGGPSGNSEPPITAGDYAKKGSGTFARLLRKPASRRRKVGD